MSCCHMDSKPNIVRRLEVYRDASIGLEYQITKLERLNARLYGLEAQNLTGMPRSDDVDTDRFAPRLFRRDEVDKELRDKVCELNRERNDLLQAISELPKAAMRNVIEMYYIDCFDWREISEVLFKSNEDYFDRKESYDRRRFRYRETALKLLLTNEQRKELPPG